MKKSRIHIKITVFLLIISFFSLSACGSNQRKENFSSETVTSEISHGNSDLSSSENTKIPPETAISEPISVALSSSATSSAVTSKTVSSKAAATAPAPKPTPKTPQELLAEMSIDEKIAQLIFVEPEKLLNTAAGLTVYSGQKFLYPVGGVIFFAGNIVTPKQTADFIKDLQKATQIPLFVAVDEEGGNVARIGQNAKMGTTPFSPMIEIKTEAAAYNVGKTIGSEIKRFGFNLDLAPVADVTSNPDINFMKGRSFGSDPETVSKLVSSCVKGFKDSGMLCTLKHFPGHGNTKTDSHNGYTLLDKTLEELRLTEFPPFKAGIDAGADIVMLGHLSVPKVTGNELPATLSPQLVKVLREEIGYQGIIMTDSLQMRAITDKFSPTEVGVIALEAGVDIILMPQNLASAFSGIKNAVQSGRLSEKRIDQSVLKILDLKKSSGIIP